MPVGIDYTSMQNDFEFGWRAVSVYVWWDAGRAKLYIYHTCFPQDPIGVKLYVYLVILLTVAALAFNTEEHYASFGASFGDIRGYLNAHNVEFYVGLATSCIVLVQLFFCHRLFVLKRSMWPLAVFIALLAIAKAACAIGAAVLYEAGGNDVHSPWHPLSTYFTRFSLISNVVTAVLISLSTTYALLSSSMTRSTRVVVNNIVRFFIETTVVASLVEIVAIVMYTVYPGTTYPSCPSQILAYIYPNMLLATLNHRAIPGAPSFAFGDENEEDKNIPSTGSGVSLFSLRFAPARVVPERRSGLEEPAVCDERGVVPFKVGAYSRAFRPVFGYE
ncbi:hypothetical protein C8R46DRAFT_1212316 [Mycena filopes]|nr:hypothetical protein C8R46DRAFT_1212316 [Mycena filopes]